MLAVLGETYPELPGGVAYVVGAAVILADEDAARAAVAGIFAASSRQRPFHWHDEGPAARRAMIGVLAEIGAVAHICVHYPTVHRRLEAARASALQTVLPQVLDDGASRLLIESRGPLEDRRDRGVILDTLNELQRPGDLRYEWRDKHGSAALAPRWHLRRRAPAPPGGRRLGIRDAA